MPTLSISETRRILESLDHRPRKSLGQNFLIDGNIVRKSVEAAGIVPGDEVVEIGPGLGTLTRALLDAGAQVHAVERDATLAAYLREQAPPGLHLMEDDAVDLPLAGLTADRKRVPAAKVVANLPYAVTSPWMEALLAGPLPAKLVLMMQKEAADRLTAQPGSKNFGAISIFLQGAYQPFFRHRVARQCFYPVPGVDSILAGWIRKSTPMVYPEALRGQIREIFTHRRKQLRALVKGRAILEEWFEESVTPAAGQNCRAEQVPLRAWERLAV